MVRKHQTATRAEKERESQGKTGRDGHRSVPSASADSGDVPPASKKTRLGTSRKSKMATHSHGVQAGREPVGFVPRPSTSTPVAGTAPDSASVSFYKRTKICLNEPF